MTNKVFAETEQIAKNIMTRFVGYVLCTNEK